MLATLFTPPPSVAPPQTPDGLERAILSCRNMCRSLARKMCPPDDNRVRREQRIEDIEGEAYLALVEAAREFDPRYPAKFSTVAHSYVSKRLKRVIDEQRLAAQHATGVELDWMPVAEGEQSTAEVGQVMDDYDRELLGRLPLAMREPVRLVILSGFTPEQVATQLGLEVKDVKLAIRNAVKILNVEREKLDRPDLFDDLDDATE